MKLKIVALVVFAALALSPDLVVSIHFPPPPGHVCKAPWWKEISSTNDAAGVNGVNDVNAAYPDRSGPINVLPPPSSSRASRIAEIRELIFGASHQHQPFSPDSFDH